MPPATTTGAGAMGNVPTNTSTPGGRPSTFLQTNGFTVPPELVEAYAQQQQLHHISNQPVPPSDRSTGSDHGSNDDDDTSRLAADSWPPRLQTAWTQPHAPQPQTNTQQAHAYDPRPWPQPQGGSYIAVRQNQSTEPGGMSRAAMAKGPGTPATQY
eukprot:CAMPEP_0183362234 /NCGR_PEP_ID=MMETSP0164_2-20130417/67826_1 /TAXON_ID=221442 /ORGANISM="Coccolithus pelagicus ssp braarudi, Strain PLY182g" /LENGTH=155 /DNA_ID=CAMNT_0025537045 /DNA_START=65 /DNA_END=530 /DNA_ORIENTATION=-